MGKKPVKYCVVDAFTDSAFKGNPAAVCLLEEEREDEWMQSVASEFNISQTGYLIRDSSDGATNPRFRLRWFTPVAEVKLCGHATLAASHFLFTSGLVNTNKIEFLTLSGVLTAKRVPKATQTESLSLENGDAQDCFLIELDFPVVPLTEFDSAEVSSISQALNGASVIDLRKTTTGDLFVVLPSGKAVADLQPQFDEIQRCPGRGIIITGPASSESGFDFISRFFCPKLGIKEDPVCGSAHCALAAYWSKKLGKCDFVAYQVLSLSLSLSLTTRVLSSFINGMIYLTQASPRGGIINLHLDEKTQRVLLQGEAITVMEGSVLV
ncbi:Phenazine biosynthesis PhzF protein [Actinidia chinensis var. chinensis]|uniref:Phenazine biosynthesis PhzF protein n=1 Tax=Actinidia chinensis var. chinensis TaxID=1590841 RepID=A0A2R6QE32_ACTCC|nr:Phenazine biosynthesis PhzF protein [Actinidia chinensis var. chinensis]